MTIEEYIPKAPAFESTRPTKVISEFLPDLNWTRLTHAALGLATEAIEIRLATTLENQLEELGDMAWFAALAHDALGKPEIPTLYNEPTTIAHLMSLCELFASRIKAGLFYGYVSKETDNNPDGWSYLPWRILLIIQTLSIEHTKGALFDSNIAKLQARYDKGFSTEAAQVRDTEKEMAAMTEQLGVLPPPPTVSIQEIAEAISNPKDPGPSLEDMIAFTTANTKTGKIKLSI